jgi:hypothetical protein
MSTLDANLVALCPTLNADAVKEIIDTDLVDGDINEMLNIAYYVAMPLTGILDACGGVIMHCKIIKVLAAHFITIRERQVKSESVAGEWSITYLGKEDLGLSASLYGQQALVMDCSGTLVKLGLKGVLFQVADYAQLADLTEEDC